MPNPVQIIPADFHVARANGLDPRRIPADSSFVLNFDRKTLSFMEFAMDAHGTLIRDSEGMGFRENRTVPLTVEPHEVGL